MSVTVFIHQGAENFSEYMLLRHFLTEHMLLKALLGAQQWYCEPTSLGHFIYRQKKKSKSKVVTGVEAPQQVPSRHCSVQVSS